MENCLKIGVIAGTPVDTKMGIDFVKEKGFYAIGYSTGADPEDQNMLQYMSPEKLTKKVLGVIKDFENKNVFHTMIYCNSLSAALNLSKIRNALPKSKIVTPLDVYKKLASKYKKIALWAANGQCLHAIEHIFYEENPSIDIIGISMLPVIKAIELGKSPDFIVKHFNLMAMSGEDLDADCLILGCTHLPYLQDCLSRGLSIQIIDPALEMLKLLTENI